MGQPYCGEPFPAKFVLDTVSVVENFAYLKRVVLSFVVPLMGFSI
jgi:hypothetical protein